VTAKDPAIVAADKFIKDKAPSKKRADWRASSSAPPKLPFDKTHDYFWHLKTNQGEITIKLFADTAPQHASSTIYLARLGFYDGLTFHRVVKGFMAQGGCPAGNGSGSPGYAYDGELDNARVHDHEGIVSMANGGPKTDGSQFFITFAKAPHLDGKHTILGEVTSGMDAVRALEAAANPDDENRPKERLAIEVSWIVVTAPAPAPAEKGKEKEKEKERK
jgi:cyclophilin family peptidyl-prolyl cis-trans isomerase